MRIGKSDPGLTGISVKAFAVTPHNSTNYVAGEARYLFVGTGGTVAVVLLDDTVVTYNVPTGGYVFVASKRVNSTGTTASQIVGHL